LTNKTISPAAIHALKEALTNIYWFRKDLRSFLYYCIKENQILSRINWDDYKRNIVSDLVDLLMKNQIRYQKTILLIMDEIVKMEDFHHLEKLDDGKTKAKNAREAVVSLRKLYRTHQEVSDEKKKIEIRRNEATEKRKKVQATTIKLDELKEEYFSLLSPSCNPQARGYKLEILLIELFKLYDLDPKSSFRVIGEQIDGAFSLQNNDFLLEAKWQKYVGIQDLDAFNGKINRKLDNTLGLFISINGFSEDAVTAHSSGRKNMILMDGSDMMAILEGRIDLVDLLVRKKRHASQTGNIYLKINEVLVL
jgi:restriction endonuclease Mrr